MPDRDAFGRDCNQMHEHYMTAKVTWRVTDSAFMDTLARHAALYLGYIEAFGPSILPHLSDSDDNPGEYLRRDLRALGLWQDEPERPVAPVKVRICKTTSVMKFRCSCKMDDDEDCITCGERVWVNGGVYEHNCPPGFKR